MKRKLGILCDCIAEENSLDTLDRIKDTGFECFFTNKTEIAHVSALKEKAVRLGLDFQFIHAPFAGINNMWLEGEDYSEIYKGMVQSVDSAAECGVPMVIIHISSGWNPPEINDLGLSRFDGLVEYAAKKGITTAFENLRKIGNLAYFTDRYESCTNVGFCYDCGHEHCYTKTVSWPDIFCHRILCTHIHDNFGRGWAKEGVPDMHLIPFDGNIDYQKIIKKLDEYDYSGSLMLEVSNRREEYASLSPDEFLKTCFERIKKISKM